tara:strand:+ start:204 stop:500 length:297 start_codon:yes stop_codon:yes gene_type:complete
VAILSENAETIQRRTKTGTFSITLTDLNSNDKTKTTLSVDSHSFDINWKVLNKISFGGGSNATFAGFRMYNKLLTDDELGKIVGIDNMRFNTSGNTYP